jgi:CheY-like chemotaxis protein
MSTFSAEKPLKKILVVEDDADIREVLVQVLEFEGYQVITAENGREALERLSNAELPGLILLDLMMPVMDGWRFREAQLSNTKISGIPVVVLSADGNLQQKAATIHAAGYLKKPVELETLLNTVGRNYLAAV